MVGWLDSGPQVASTARLERLATWMELGPKNRPPSPKYSLTGLRTLASGAAACKRTAAPVFLPLFPIASQPSFLALRLFPQVASALKSRAKPSCHILTAYIVLIAIRPG